MTTTRSRGYWSPRIMATPKKIATKCSFNDQEILWGTEGTNENGENSLECVFCREQFVKKGDLYIHIWSHTDQDTVKCPVCWIELYSNWNLRCHYSLHGEGPPFECVICKERFPDKRTLRQHIHSHSGDRPYQCLACAMVFANEPTRRRHVSLVTPRGIRRKCPECGKRLRNLRSLQNHMNAHKIRPKEPYPCPECGEIFRWKKDLTKHTSTQHTPLWALASYPCTECGQIFHERKQLTKHTHTQHSKAQMCCQTRGKTFRSEARLNQHDCIPGELRSQKAARRKYRSKVGARHLDAGYQCSACGMGCVSKQALVSHLYSHSDDKPFQCTLCGKRYPGEFFLKRHYDRCHFKCAVCGGTFKTQQTLHQHVVKNHTDVGYFECILCLASFLGEHALNDHMREVHRNTPIIQ